MVTDTRGKGSDRLETTSCVRVCALWLGAEEGNVEMIIKKYVRFHSRVYSKVSDHPGCKVGRSRGTHFTRKRSSRRTRRRKQKPPTCNDNAAPGVVSPHRAVGRLGHCKDVRFTLVESRAVVPVPESEGVVDAHQPVGCAVSAVWCV
jgi:hypothetical protein